MMMAQKVHFQVSGADVVIVGVMLEGEEEDIADDEVEGTVEEKRVVLV